MHQLLPSCDWAILILKPYGEIVILYWFAYEIILDGFNSFLVNFDKQKEVEVLKNNGFPVR